MPDRIDQTFGIDASQALKELQTLDAGFAKLESRLNSLASAMGSANKNMSTAASNKLGEAFSSTADQAAKANVAVGSLAVSTGLIARILTTQLVVSMFGQFRRELQATASDAAEFQHQIALIQTIAGGTGFDRIAGEVRNLSENFNIPLLQAAQGVYNALSNQVGDFGQSIEFAGEAALFAKATNSSLKDSVDLLSGALQSFGLNASETNRVSGVFFTAIDKGRVTATELANSFGRVGPTAQAAGLSIEETAAAIASISVKGSKSAESLTQLRGIISGLIKPTPALRNELEKLGFTEATSAVKTLGFAQTLDALSKSTGGSQQALATLFPNVRALNGETSLAADEFKTLVENIKLMETSGRDFAARKALDVLGTDAERVSKELNKLKVELTLGLGQEALRVADNLFKISGGADQLIKSGKELIPVIAGIGASLIALNSGAGLVGLLPAAIGAGTSLGRFIDDFQKNLVLGETKALESANKAFLDNQKKLLAERLDAAKAGDAARIDSAQQSLVPLNQIYIQDLNNAKAANSALVDSTKNATEKMVSLRERLVSELAQASSDSERAVKDSVNRIADLQAKQSDRDFSGKISGLSDVQQFAALAQRADQFARDAARQLGSAISPEQIQKALALFDKAQTTGESAKSIAERTGNRTLELQAAGKLKNVTQDQINAERQLEGLQRGRLPGLQAEADKQRDIVQKIREQVKILQDNTGAFNAEGQQFSSADLAKRAANRQAAEQKLAGLGLTPRDFTQVALLGLGDFLTKSGQQLKQQPLQLAFDVEKGSADIQNRLTNAFSKFKLKSSIDFGGLESVVGKIENPAQLTQGFDKLIAKAAELRQELSNAFSLSQKEQAAKDELDQLLSSLDQQKSVVDNIGGFSPQAKAALNNVKTTFDQIRADGIITPDELAQAAAVAADFKSIADTFGIQKVGLNAANIAVGNILQKFQAISELQAKAIDVGAIQQQLAPLEDLIGRINPAPNFAAAATSLSQSVKPAQDIATALSTAATAAETISALNLQAPVNKAFGGGIDFRATGGRGTDTIPAMLSPGEFVVNAASTGKFFSQIQAINAGKAPVFRDNGGNVTNNTVGDIVINGAGSPEKTARAVAKELRREFRRGTSRL